MAGLTRMPRRKINTSPSTIEDKDVLKKPLCLPLVKKMDLHFPLGLTVTARNMKGVTIKDACDAIYKQYKKKVGRSRRSSEAQSADFLASKTMSSTLHTSRDSNGTRMRAGPASSSIRPSRRRSLHPATRRTTRRRPRRRPRSPTCSTRRLERPCTYSLGDALVVV